MANRAIQGSLCLEFVSDKVETVDHKKKATTMVCCMQSERFGI